MKSNSFWKEHGIIDTDYNNRPRLLSIQFFSVCFIKSLTDKRSVKFQLPWRGSTNFTVVSSETERPMYHLGTDRDPVYTGPNEYLPGCNPLTHRGVTVQILLRHFIVYTNPCKFCQCQYWIFFNERRVKFQAFTSHTVQKVATVFRCLHESA